jgi:hypothetical protein
MESASMKEEVAYGSPKRSGLSLPFTRSTRIEKRKGFLSLSRLVSHAGTRLRSNTNAEPKWLSLNARLHCGHPVALTARRLRRRAHLTHHLEVAMHLFRVRLILALIASVDAGVARLHIF